MVDFNIWNCITKIMDAFVVTYIPFRLLPLRFGQRRPAIFYLSSLAVIAMVYYGCDWFFGRPRLWITLTVNVFFGLVYVLSFFRGRIFTRAVLVCSAVPAVVLTHFFLGSLLASMGFSVGLWSWQSTFFSALLLLVYRPIINWTFWLARYQQ